MEEFPLKRNNILWKQTVHFILQARHENVQMSPLVIHMVSYLLKALKVARETMRPSAMIAEV